MYPQKYILLPWKDLARLHPAITRLLLAEGNKNAKLWSPKADRQWKRSIVSVRIRTENS